MLLYIGLAVAGLIVGYIGGAITMFFVYRNNVRNIQEMAKELKAKLDIARFGYEAIKHG